MALNLLFGPPRNPDFLCSFFSLAGKHIVCGGSTAQQVANFLGESLVLSLHYENPEVPPIARLKGVDLVTEGIVTLNKVLQMFFVAAPANDAQDGASLVYKELKNSAEVNFFVGKDNPANKEFTQLKTKKEIVSCLESYLQNFGKKVTVREV